VVLTATEIPLEIVTKRQFKAEPIFLAQPGCRAQLGNENKRWTITGAQVRLFCNKQARSIWYGVWTTCSKRDAGTCNSLVYMALNNKSFTINPSRWL
jgi:hypothetical protein